MSVAKTEPCETRQFSDLRLHDLYSYLPTPPAEEVKAKVMEMQAKGQTEPLEVVDDVVIHGHVIFLASKALNLKKVKTISREDYRDMDEALLGLHVLDRYYDRSKSDLFRLATLYDVWLVWKSFLPRRRLHSNWQINFQLRKALREQIAAMFEKIGNCNRRTLERYREALVLPGTILSAIRNGSLPMSVCPRLCRLSREILNEIRDLIRQGIPPREAVDRFLPPDRTGPKHANTAMQAIIRPARRVLPLLEDGSKSVGVLDDDEIDTLRRLGAVLKEKIKNNASARRRHARLMAEIQQDLDEGADNAA